MIEVKQQKKVVQKILLKLSLHWKWTMFLNFDEYDYYICGRATDMRCGYHSLARIVKQEMLLGSFSKSVYFLLKGTMHHEDIGLGL